MDKCTYAKEGETKSKYCFAVGDMQPECKDSGSSTGGNGAGTDTSAAAGEAGSTDADGGAPKTSPVAGGAATAGNGGVATTVAGGAPETTPGATGVATTSAGGSGGDTVFDKFSQCVHNRCLIRQG